MVPDVETQFKCRPLSFVEKDVQLPNLMSATLLFQRSSYLPQREPWREDANLCKQAKKLQTSKRALSWRRWTREYLATLRERHRGNHKGKSVSLQTADVIFVGNDEKNRGK